MLLEHSSAAQPNRRSRNLRAQKERSEAVSHPGHLMQLLFDFARRELSEGGSMYLTCDRLSEDHNKAKTERNKSERVFWVIWSSD